MKHIPVIIVGLIAAGAFGGGYFLAKTKLTHFLVENKMRNRTSSLVFLVALAGCDGRPKAETKETDKPVQPAETTAGNEMPRRAWNVGASGLLSTEFFPPY